MKTIKENIKENIKELIDVAIESGKETKEILKTFCKEHKKTILFKVLPTVAGYAIDIGYIIIMRKDTKERRALKENYIFDSSAGHYYSLTRPPKNTELLLIDQQRANGARLGDILNGLGLLDK